jgi:hypothetical protein
VPAALDDRGVERDDAIDDGVVMRARDLAGLEHLVEDAVDGVLLKHACK